ncbi:MAG: hypothetical protein MO847_00070 [Candidatus Protistobacter heckmanni]|nr:hypothetical protein [Candidatus Protistobacter heckmanni]
MFSVSHSHPARPTIAPPAPPDDPRPPTPQATLSATLSAAAESQFPPIDAPILVSEAQPVSWTDRIRGMARTGSWMLSDTLAQAWAGGGSTISTLRASLPGMLTSGRQAAYQLPHTPLEARAGAQSGTAPGAPPQDAEAAASALPDMPLNAIERARIIAAAGGCAFLRDSAGTLAGVVAAALVRGELIRHPQELRTYVTPLLTTLSAAAGGIIAGGAAGDIAAESERNVLWVALAAIAGVALGLAPTALAWSTGSRRALAELATAQTAAIPGALARDTVQYAFLRTGPRVMVVGPPTILPPLVSMAPYALILLAVHAQFLTLARSLLGGGAGAAGALPFGTASANVSAFSAPLFNDTAAANASFLAALHQQDPLEAVEALTPY